MTVRRRAAARNVLAEPVLGPRQVVYQNAYQQIERLEVDFGAFQREYYITRYGPRAAVVVARDRDILLCRQYRLHVQRVALEIPGGAVEPDETPEQAAIRECDEETKVRCRELRPLIRYHLGDSIVNPTHVFSTSACTAGRWRRNGREVESPVWVPLERCLEMIETEIVDHMSIIALLAYDRLRRQGRTGAPEAA